MNINHVGGGIDVCVAMTLGMAVEPSVGNESCYGMWILHPIRAVKGKKSSKKPLLSNGQWVVFCNLNSRSSDRVIIVDRVNE